MKINAEVSITLKLGDPRNNEYTKITCGLQEIDSEIDLETQLDNARSILGEVFEKLADQVGDEFAKMQEARKPKPREVVNMSHRDRDLPF